MTTPSAAANAYASLARMSDPSAGLGKALGESNGPSFGSLLKAALGAAVEAGRKSDAQQQAMVAGKANIVDVRGPQDPRGRRRARHPDRREPAAGARAARDRRRRPGDPARALPGGGRGHRLRHAA